MQSKLMWKSGMSFEAENRGHSSLMDVSKEQGGADTGPTPKEVVLNAMCACSGMDVVAIAKKMRTEVGKFWMEAHAQKTNTIPSYFSEVHMKYYFEGENLNQEKLIQAISLSMTKHCGVSYMISKTSKITYDVTINGNKVHDDKANFQLEVIL